jgi:Single-strand binding protein family
MATQRPNSRPRKTEENQYQSFLESEDELEKRLEAQFAAIDVETEKAAETAETNEGLAEQQANEGAGRPRTPNHRAKPTADKDGHIHYPSNCWHVIGYLQDDPELTISEAGLTIVKGRMRVQQGKDRKTGEWKPTMWLNWVMFGDIGEAAYNDLRHKDKVMVKGRLQMREWTGRDDKTRQTYEIVADYMKLQEEQEEPY